jgi:hypothetical protein
MSVVIGDYVHYSYEQYKYWGTNRRGTTRGLPFDTSSAQFNSIVKPSNSGLIKELEIIIQDTMNFFKSYKNLPRSSQTQIRRELSKSDLGELLRYANNQTRNGIHIGPNGDAKVTKLTANKTSKKVIGGQDRYITEEKLKSLLISTEYLIAKLGNSLNGKKWNTMLTEYRSVITSAIEAEALLEQLMAQSSKSKKQNIVYGRSTSAGSVTKNTGIHSLVSIMNRIQNYLAQFGHASEIQGDWGEMVAEVSANCLASLIGGTVNSELKKTIETSHSAIDTAKILGGDNILQTDGGNYKLRGDLGNGYYWQTTNATKGKTDVEIVGPDENSSLRLSVKNVSLNQNFGGNIHILSGTSVLQLLQNDGLFLNHYLNIVPERVGHSIKEETPDSILRTNFHNIAKSLIVARALTGSTFRLSENGDYVEGANAFVVMNATTGKVKCFSMKEIVNQIEKNAMSASFFHTGDFDNINVIKNKWSTGKHNSTLADTRILEMIKTLHQMKLDVYINLQTLGVV